MPNAICTTASGYSGSPVKHLLFRSLGPLIQIPCCLSRLFFLPRDYPLRLLHYSLQTPKSCQPAVYILSQPWLSLGVCKSRHCTRKDRAYAFEARLSSLDDQTQSQTKIPKFSYPKPLLMLSEGLLPKDHGFPPEPESPEAARKSPKEFALRA